MQGAAIRPVHAVLPPALTTCCACCGAAVLQLRMAGATLENCNIMCRCLRYE